MLYISVQWISHEWLRLYTVLIVDCLLSSLDNLG